MIVLTIIQKLVCLSSSEVGAYESHRINSGLGQKLVIGYQKDPSTIDHYYTIGSEVRGSIPEKSCWKYFKIIVFGEISLATTPGVRTISY